MWLESVHRTLCIWKIRTNTTAAKMMQSIIYAEHEALTWCYTISSATLPIFYYDHHMSKCVFFCLRKKSARRKTHHWNIMHSIGLKKSRGPWLCLSRTWRAGCDQPRKTWFHKHISWVIIWYTRISFVVEWPTCTCYVDLCANFYFRIHWYVLLISCGTQTPTLLRLVVRLCMSFLS